MPFDSPTLPALITRALSDLDSTGALRRSDASVLARVQSGAAYGLHQYLGWQFLQLFPDTAEEEMLLRHGQARGVVRKAAVAAAGLVQVTGTTGAAVDAGAPLQASDGRAYTVAEGAILVAGAATLQVQAVDAGALGNAAVGEALEFTSPVLGVNSAAVVAAGGISGGVDLEVLEDYRQRVLERYRVVPHGGNAADYVAWAKEVAGVTRAWCKRNWLGPGTVGVFVVNDAADPITPAAQELAAVGSYMETLRPVTAEVHVLSPGLVAVPYRINVTPDTPRVRTAVVAALQALHDRESDLGATLLRTHISEAISGATGEVDHELVLPAADVVPAAGELLVYGGVTWE